MIPTTDLIVNLNAKISPAILAGILDCNVSLLYQHSQAGRLPAILTEATYKEAIQMYVEYYKKSTEVKKLKAIKDQELLEDKLENAKRLRDIREAKSQDKDKSSRFGDFDDEMTKLTMAKLTQGIKLDRVREEQLWLKIAIDRKDYIDVEEIVDLAEPFLMTLRNILIDIALTTPELEKKIDQAMETIYALGVTLVEDADLDSKNYVQDMLARGIDE